jgi:hypothetical protein
LPDLGPGQQRFHDCRPKMAVSTSPSVAARIAVRVIAFGPFGCSSLVVSPGGLGTGPLVEADQAVVRPPVQVRQEPVRPIAFRPLPWPITMPTHRLA